ncbi:hypothetical protein [Flavobacterium hungaricum]|uniref:Uncharacterized protein n=1 Tax=Flavobacterium hungaricum TaxID=2082725 RepID=A0ABR9TF57_9FLAO|nr:hypothetical protein [Flavobacterium hungaricum]MBE8723687.1 hypothetical protein [Flavobacterium hungaricum]
MTGLKFIENYPSDIREKITNKYGNIENLYQTIFKLIVEDYKSYQMMPRNDQKISKIQNQLFAIEEKLDGFGIEGIDVIAEVRSDYGDLLVNREINALNEFLKDLGIEYPTVRQWLNDTYNI